MLCRACRLVPVGSLVDLVPLGAGAGAGKQKGKFAEAQQRIDLNSTNSLSN